MPKTIEPAHVAVAVPTAVATRRLNDLPDDALHCIFLHLDDATLFALGCTSTRLATYLRDAASLWQSLAAAKCVTACAPLSARETLLHLRVVAKRLRPHALQPPPVAAQPIRQQRLWPAWRR